jgi:hypothetical protein
MKGSYNCLTVISNFAYLSSKPLSYRDTGKNRKKHLNRNFSSKSSGYSRDGCQNGYERLHSAADTMVSALKKKRFILFYFFQNGFAIQKIRITIFALVFLCRRKLLFPWSQIYAGYLAARN